MQVPVQLWNTDLLGRQLKLRSSRSSDQVDDDDPVSGNGKIVDHKTSPMLRQIEQMAPEFTMVN
jgi:hypothetical protein